MTYLIRILLFLVLLVGSICGAALMVNRGAMDGPIRYALKYYLNSSGFQSKIEGLSVKDYTVKINNIELNNEIILLNISNLQIDILALGLKMNETAKANINCPDISILDKSSNKQLFKGEVQIDYSKIFFATNTDLELKFLKVTTNDDLPVATITYSYHQKGNSEETDYNINFSEKSYLAATEKTQNGKTSRSISIKNMPIMLYRIAHRINPKNPALVFMDSFIESGNIVQGKMQMNFDSKQGQDEIQGEFKIADLDLKYDDYFPIIKNIDVDISILGNDINFKINKGYSADSLISDGNLHMTWEGIDNTVLYLKSKVIGPAKDLADFIESEALHSLQLANIDLRKIKGNFTSDLIIDIPLKPGTKNKYNISANIPNVSLNIFKDHVQIDKASLKGLFDGDHLTISGNGHINGFKSTIDFVYNDAKDSEFNHKLSIKSHINKDGKIPFTTLFDGQTFLELEYLNKDHKGYLKANSDLKNLDFDFNKLGIRKKQNESGKLSLEGTFEDPTHWNMQFKLNGQNSLDIQGELVVSDNNTTIKIPKIKHYQTKLNAYITSSPDLFNAKLKGNILDLSNADMLSFLKKEQSGSATQLEINVDNVKLKNNIELDDFKLKFDCDKIRCFSGYINSKIGSKNVNVTLSAAGEREEWKVNCDNAGALLKGLGTYNSMKSGTMSVLMHTSRKEVKPGEIIPILEGSFEVKKFVLQDAKAIARLISVVSLPGFISFISGNKDISFSDMNGKFSFENEILSIINSKATGPYFDFTMKGKIDLTTRQMVLTGYVNPALYGVTKLVSTIPLFGKILTGTKNRQGLFSAPYRIKDKY